MPARWRRIRHGLVCCLLCWHVSGWAAELPKADAPVWQVSNGANQLWLGGSIHILSKQDFPLPAVYEQAYQRADKVFFEIDMSADSMSEAERLLYELMALPEGVTLADRLSESVLERLAGFLEQRDMTLAQFNSLKPGLVALILSQWEMQRQGMTEDGLDMVYFRQAQRDNKPVGWFETTDQQIRMLSTLGEGNEDEYMSYTLDDLESANDTLLEFRSLWREGNRQVARELLQEMQDELPEVYELLLVERNRAWLDDLEALLESPEPELVLVGALHLPGEHGLLQLLLEKGYQVQPFYEAR